MAGCRLLVSLAGVGLGGLLGCSRASGVVRPEYATALDRAAVAACKRLWTEEPEAKHWEYCGVLYRDDSGDIRWGAPERGDREWRCFPSDPPEDAVLLGRYHSHRYGAEPSGDDKRRAIQEPSLGHYICGPSGLVRRFSPEEGTVNVP